MLIFRHRSFRYVFAMSLCKTQQELEDQLTCAICLCFYTDPRILTCGHSFCFPCIAEYILKNTNIGSKLKCPLCRTKTLLDNVYFFHNLQVADTVVKKLETIPSDIPQDIIKFRKPLDSAITFEIGKLFLQGRDGIHPNLDIAKSFIEKAANEDHYPAMDYIINRAIRENDGQKAMIWLQYAESKGFIQATEEIGIMYFQGTILPQDYSKAYQHLSKAASSDSSTCKSYEFLGMMYAHGLSVPTDMEQAFAFFQRACDKPNASPSAYFALGWFYWKELGAIPAALPTKERYEKAFQWMKRSGESRYAPGIFMTGYFYFYGVGTTVNYTIALEYFHRGEQCSIVEPCIRPQLAQTCLQECQFFIGVCDYEKLDTGFWSYSNAVSYFKKASEKNHFGAMVRLGHCYYYGHGFDHPNYEEAFKLFQKVANDCENSRYLSQALYYLGLCNYKGNGVPQDYCAAFLFFQKAHSLANHNGFAAAYLARCYRKSRGIPELNYEERKTRAREILDASLVALEAISIFPPRSALHIYTHRLGKLYKECADFSLWTDIALEDYMDKLLYSALYSNRSAQLKLAEVYFYNKKDYCAAYVWASKVTENTPHYAKKSTMGQTYFLQGLMVLNGKGKCRDVDNAKTYMRKAADYGSVPAKVYLDAWDNYANEPYPNFPSPMVIDS